MVLQHQNGLLSEHELYETEELAMEEEFRGRRGGLPRYAARRFPARRAPARRPSPWGYRARPRPRPPYPQRPYRPFPPIPYPVATPAFWPQPGYMPPSVDWQPHAQRCDCSQCAQQTMQTPTPPPSEPMGPPPGMDAGPAPGAPPDGAADSELGYAAPTPFIRWVQASLNRVLGRQLRITGHLNRATRAALAEFQRRQGMPASGRPGRVTVARLVAAGASPPPRRYGMPTGPVMALPMPGGSVAYPSMPAPGSLTPVYPAPRPRPGGAVMPARVQITSPLRQRIAALANREWLKWGRGTRKETDPALRPTLQAYWSATPGGVPRVPNWWTAKPWSAAFISWVMRQAGAGNAFKRSGGHSYYIAAAKQNRISNSSNPIKAYRVSEASPRVGDLVCRARAGSGATYDNIRGGMSTHCDFVTAVRPGAIEVIGGNVSNSVGKKTIRTNAAGRIVKPGFFAVIRVGS